jgi:hypothetical protein
MIAAVLAGAVFAAVFIRPALVHDSNLPISVTGRRQQ